VEQRRNAATYEVDDVVFGLSDEERQFRQMVFNLAQKELNPQVRGGYGEWSRTRPYVMGYMYVCIYLQTSAAQYKTTENKKDN
jgi:hypothetical protein